MISTGEKEISYFATALWVFLQRAHQNKMSNGFWVYKKKKTKPKTGTLKENLCLVKVLKDIHHVFFFFFFEVELIYTIIFVSGIQCVLFHFMLPCPSSMWSSPSHRGLCPQAHTAVLLRLAASRSHAPNQPRFSIHLNAGRTKHPQMLAAPFPLPHTVVTWLLLVFLQNFRTKLEE